MTRNRDQADRGEEPATPDTPEKSDETERAPAVMQQATPTKQSKWAKMAAERAQWDNDFVQKTPSKPIQTESQIASHQSSEMQSKPSCQNNVQTYQSPVVPSPNSAQAQVAEALAKMGKAPSLANQKTQETPKSSRFERKIDKNQSLVELAGKAKVNALIKYEDKLVIIMNHD